MDSLLLLLALLGYLGVAGVAFIKPEPLAAQWGPRLAVPAVAVHGWALAHHAWLTGRAPVHTPGTSLASLSLLVALGYLWAVRRPRMSAVAGLFMPVVAVLLALSFVVPSPVLPEPGAFAATPWVPVHVGLLFVGLAGFTVSFCLSSLYLIVQRLLKQKQLLALQRMPSLEALDRLNTRAIVVGFLAFTLGIATGGVLTALRGQGGLGLVGWASVAMWVWYGLTVQVRVVGGWRGRLAAILSLVGFAGVTVSLLGVMVVTEAWHP